MPADALAAALQDGATVITAGPRLARELTDEFDRRQLARGLAAWPRADILPFSAWLRRTWQHIAGESPATLLDSGQLLAVWTRIIADDLRRDDRRRPTATAPLWNEHATAKHAVAGWRLAQEWQISLADCARSPHPDHRRWYQWAREFSRLCARRNWLDEHTIAARLQARLAAADALPAELFAAKLIWAGFDYLYPQQRTLLAAWKKRGGEAEIIAPPTAAAPNIALRAAARDEWLAAARWARQKLTAQPDAKLAIVAPDLDAAAAEIEYALNQILCPRRLVDPDDRAQLPYHLSLGKPLARYPVAAAALTVLGVCAAAMKKYVAREDIRALARLPCIAGAESEATARAKLDLRLRQRTAKISWEWLLGAELDACPILRRALTQARAAAANIAAKNSFTEWARAFTEWLKIFGWPGERAPSSEEYQACQAYNKELRALVLLDAVLPPASARAAQMWLRRKLDARLFQAEAQAAPVQVLSVNEAAGQKFDALWFGGLREDAWPPTMHPSPFMEPRLQRRAGVFAARAEGSVELAEIAQRRLLASAKEVVLSYTKIADGVELEPSPLLAEFSPAAEDATAAATDFPTAAQMLYRAKPDLQRHPDARAPQLPRGYAGGGIGVLADQAACPFRAFARHRLGARAVAENEAGLDAAARGNLLHRALQLVWERLGDSKKLRELNSAELTEIVQTAVTAADAESQKLSDRGREFHRVQRAWAAEVAREWLAVDKMRAAEIAEFTVTAREADAELELGGLRLNFKVDRIDTLANGKLLLLDYKTGANLSTQWLAARATAPQLALYTLAQTAAVETIAYAKVRRAECGFVGVSENALTARLPGMKTLAAVTAGEITKFAELRRQWRAIFTQLAEEFMAGAAGVTPAKDACGHCDLHGLCRIDAAAGE